MIRYLTGPTHQTSFNSLRRKGRARHVPVAESVRRLKHDFGIVGKENYRIVVIPDAGHSFIDTQQKQLMPALALWVEENVTQATHVLTGEVTEFATSFRHGIAISAKTVCASGVQLRAEA